MQLKAERRELFHCICLEKNQNKAYSSNLCFFRSQFCQFSQSGSQEKQAGSRVMQKSHSCHVTFALGQPGLGYLGSQISSLFLQEAESKPLLKHLQTNTTSPPGYLAFISGKRGQSSMRHSDSKKPWLRHWLALLHSCLLERVGGWDSSSSFVESGSPLGSKIAGSCTLQLSFLSAEREFSGSFISSCLFIP